MPISRRAALSLLALGAVSTAPACGTTAAATTTTTAHPGRGERRATGLTANPVVLENQLTGDGGWRLTGTRTADDAARQIQGYAGATSVNAGDPLDFHVSVARDRPFTVSVYRLGHYDGAGGRRMLTSGPLPGRELPLPATDAGTGLIACDWPVAWTLAVPADWTSGYFLAVFETDDGWRSCTPFVVRNDQRAADFLVVVPFTTYQAYNFWPADGRTARNLYRGYLRPGKVGGITERAFQVSFDRPYSGPGLPKWSELDLAAARWLESAGFDVAYVSSLDLHEQRVRPDRHCGLIFPGHDEYWSQAMRDTAERAVDDGTHLAFLAANNIYWHIRLEAARDGRANRVVTCYKDAPDPDAGAPGPTRNWRKLGKRHSQAEQRLLGVQYNGMLASPVPLRITQSRHWFWAGTGVRDGDTVAGLVAVEADGHHPKIKLARKARQALLSDTPYQDQLGRGARVQNTSVYETAQGTLVFAAATFHWCLALVESPYTDARIQRATRNLVTRMLAGRRDRRGLAKGGAAPLSMTG
ncbi:hypothetical protein GCM10020358_64990 [Amorphoplanes nipponensis]|uniref:N,N-dimethylformamidase beta subunit-like C-terminal domain-containing protein n=1 Tax=Actinoplanes nipponensis TaxID=135950 RepID=A0A919JET4_9ACTN|nr:N,N-dimethylformamidase beta subunit family domain-containing protein [Actinoplanes nipponensis]GIE48443.1 hypothetical protein Ani05nite_19770 [Actinoplanes nipponensis]